MNKFIFIILVLISKNIFCVKNAKDFQYQKEILKLNNQKSLLQKKIIKALKKSSHEKRIEIIKTIIFNANGIELFSDILEVIEDKKLKQALTHALTDVLKA